MAIKTWVQLPTSPPESIV